MIVFYRLVFTTITLLLSILTNEAKANYCYQATSTTANLPSNAYIVQCSNAAGCMRGKVVGVGTGGNLLGATYFWDCMGYSDFGSYTPAWSWWTVGVPSSVAWNMWTQWVAGNTWSVWGSTSWAWSTIASWSSSTTSWTNWQTWSIVSPWLSGNGGAIGNTWATWNSWGYTGSRRYTCTDGGFEGYWNPRSNGYLSTNNGAYVYYCNCCADGCNSKLTCKFFSNSNLLKPSFALLLIVSTLRLIL